MSASVTKRAVVLLLGALVLAAGSVGAMRTFGSAIAADAVDPASPLTGPAAVRDRERIHHAQFECIRGEIDAQVPEGSTVFVPLDPATFEADLWKQRLIEMAYPVATIVGEPGAGTVTLRISNRPGGTCGGVSLVVEQG